MMSIRCIVLSLGLLVAYLVLDLILGSCHCYSTMCHKSQMRDNDLANISHSACKNSSPTCMHYEHIYCTKGKSNRPVVPVHGASRIGTRTSPPLESILAVHTCYLGVQSYSKVHIPAGVKSCDRGTAPF